MALLREQIKRLQSLLDEAEAQTQGHPLIVKRCVYAIAQKDPTPAGLSKAFAICIANAQKRGALKKGTGSSLTGKGKEAEKEKEQTPSDSGYSDSAYEKLLANVRKLRKGKSESVIEAIRRRRRKRDLSCLKGESIVNLYCELHREILGEDVKKSPKDLRAAISGISDSIRSMKLMAKAKSSAALPGVLRQLSTYALGGNGKLGVLGALGIQGLETAVGLKTGQDVDKALATLQTAIEDSDVDFDWSVVDQKIKSLNTLANDLEGTLDPSELTSLLADVFIDLAGLFQPLTDSSNARVMAAASDVFGAMKKQGRGFIALSHTDFSEEPE